MSYLCHMHVFAELFADILSYSSYLFKDRDLRASLIKVHSVVIRELGVQP